MKDYAIRQLGNPVGDQDAVNLTSMKKYVSTTSITTGIAHKQNALAHLTQRVGVLAVNNVTSVTVEDFVSNLHSVNKKAYTFNLVRTGVNSFNSRLALNKIPLKPKGSTLYVSSSFIRKLIQIGFSVLQPLTRLILLLTIPSTSTVTTRNIHAPLFIRTNTKTTITLSILIFQIRVMMARHYLKRPL